MTEVVVHNLRDGSEQTFVGPTSHQAVVAAYEQSRGNWNTWDYPKFEDHPAPHGDNGRTVFCGDFATRVK